MSRKKRRCPPVSISCTAVLAWGTLHIAAAAPDHAGEQAAELAVQAEKRGDFERAIAQFRRAIRLGTDTPEIRSDLGIAYFQAGENVSALGEFRSALAARPQFLPATIFSGLALLKLKRPKEAVPFLEKAHAAQPQALEITLALARAELASNRIGRANVLYGEAAQTDARSAEAWFGIGITDRVLAETEAKTARRLGKIEPGSAADARIKQLLASSRSAIQKGLAIDPDSVRAEMIFAESFRIAERYGDAIREYKTIIQREPDFAPAWAGLAAAYSASGSATKAIQPALRAIALDPSDADSEMLAGGLYLRAGDYIKAKPHILRAMQLRPSLSAAHLDLAKIYIARHNLAAAVPELQQAAKGDANAYYLLGVTLRELGRLDDANAAMQKFRELHKGQSKTR